MAVAVDTEASFSPGNTIALFEGPYRLGEVNAFHSFDIAPDGRRFLMLKEWTGADRPSDQEEITVVLNWFEELKRLVPVD